MSNNYNTPPPEKFSKPGFIPFLPDEQALFDRMTEAERIYTLVRWQGYLHENPGNARSGTLTRHPWPRA